MQSEVRICNFLAVLKTIHRTAKAGGFVKLPRFAVLNSLEKCSQNCKCTGKTNTRTLLNFQCKGWNSKNVSYIYLPQLYLDFFAVPPFMAPFLKCDDPPLTMSYIYTDLSKYYVSAWLSSACFFGCKLRHEKSSKPSADTFLGN